MPSWFINTLLLEASGFILVVAGCFVAGVVSEALEVAEAKEKERKRVTTERFAQMFTEMNNHKRERDEARLTVLGDTNETAWELFYRGVMTPNEARSATSCAEADEVIESTVFYADDVPYMSTPDTEYRITRLWDGTQVIEHLPYGTTERK